MIAPEKKVTGILAELYEKMVNEIYFTEFESQLYARKMEGIGKATSEENLAWAYYYACNKELEKALHFFKKSLHYNNPIFLGNYLTYLVRNGLIDEFLLATESASLKPCFRGVGQVLWSELFISILRGNLMVAREQLEGLIKLDNEYSLWAKKIELDLDRFIKEAKLDSQQLQILGDIFITLIREYRLFALGWFTFKSYPEFGVNHLSLVIDYRHKDIIGAINYELAMAIASEEKLDRKKFSVSVDMFERSNDDKAFSHQMMQ